MLEDDLQCNCGGRGDDQIRNDCVRERCGSERSMNEITEEDVLKWSRHVERMS